jgi:UDP-N-acetylglucosamine 2-epimerase (non-hydrolysing)
LRDETAHPITVTAGTNQLVGLDPERVAAESRKILRGEGKLGRPPATWDGKAAERIVSVLAAGAPAWSLDEALSEP